jgi:hypothetical protein
MNAMHDPEDGRPATGPGMQRPPVKPRRPSQRELVLASLLRCPPRG